MLIEIRTFFSLMELDARNEGGHVFGLLSEKVPSSRTEYSTKGRGKIVTIDQLSYHVPNPSSKFRMNVPFVGDSSVSFESVGIGC